MFDNCQNVMYRLTVTTELHDNNRIFLLRIEQTAPMPLTIKIKNEAPPNNGNDGTSGRLSAILTQSTDLKPVTTKPKPTQTKITERPRRNRRQTRRYQVSLS